MSRSARLIILYAVLGICVLNAMAAIFTGKEPPEALYGVLGTLGAYVLMSDSKDKDNEEKKKDGALSHEEKAKLGLLPYKRTEPTIAADDPMSIAVEEKKIRNEQEDITTGDDDGTSQTVVD